MVRRQQRPVVVSPLPPPRDPNEIAKEQALADIHREPSNLQHVPEMCRNDTHIVLRAVRLRGNTLQYALEVPKNDRDVVFAAMMRDEFDATQDDHYQSDSDDSRAFATIAKHQAALVNPSNLQYASEEFKNHKEYMLVAVKRNWRCFEYVSEQLKHDYTFVLEAVKKKPHCLSHAPESFKNDGEFMLATVDARHRCLLFCSGRLKSDRELMTLAIGKSWRCFEYVSDALKDDKEFVRMAVNKNACCLEYASETLKNDKEIVNVAVTKDPRCLRFASQQVKDDRQIVFATVKREPDCLSHASEQLKNDREIVLAAVNQEPYCFRYASEELRNDRELVLEVLEKVEGGLLESVLENYLCQSIRSDIEIFREMVQEGSLHSLDKEDESSLSVHLDERLSFRSVFWELVVSGIQVPCETQSGSFLPPNVLEHVAEYAGVPVGSNLRQLRLVQELLPIISLCAKRTGKTWAILVGACRYTKWCSPSESEHSKRVKKAPKSNQGKLDEDKVAEAPRFNFSPSSPDASTVAGQEGAEEKASTIPTVTPANPFGSVVEPVARGLPVSFVFGSSPPAKSVGKDDEKTAGVPGASTMACVDRKPVSSPGLANPFGSVVEDPVTRALPSPFGCSAKTAEIARLNVDSADCAPASFVVPSPALLSPGRFCLGSAPPRRRNGRKISR